MKSISKNKPTILVIESERLTLEFLVSNLVQNGYKILKAISADEAFSIIENDRIDLIIISAEMKGNTELEILKDIKKNAGMKGIPIIVTTSKESKAFENIFDFPGTDIISKPINYSELLWRIKSSLSQADLTARLKKSIQEKDKLISVLAHDLKRPFANLLSMTQLLSESAKSCSQEEIAELAQENYKSVKNTYALLENLLEWYKLVNNKTEPKFSQFDLNSVCRRVVFDSKDFAFSKNISLISQVDAESFVYADENMIYRVVSSLVENAIKFSPPKSKVIISCDQNSHYQKVKVEDKGVGIEQQDFDKLFRIDELFTTPGTNNERGFGLGLVLAKEIVEANRGKLTFESIAGEGSKFDFTVPITESVLVT